MSDRGDDHLAALAHEAQRLADIGALGHVGGDDTRVRELPAGQFGDHTVRLVDSGGGVGGAEINCSITLVLYGIHRDDMARAGGFSALYGVTANSTHTEHDDSIARPNLSGIDHAAET